METSMLEVAGLTKVYQMDSVVVHALRGVDLKLSAGELICLLGPSGSGKSTLLNIIGGLDTPTAGTVRYADQDLTRASQSELTTYRREHVGFVFQFYNLMPSLTAEENVALVTEIAPGSMRPSDALSLVGLEDRRDHFPAQLSGGEQQRVAIARAVAKRPQILLCEETRVVVAGALFGLLSATVPAQAQTSVELELSPFTGGTLFLTDLPNRFHVQRRGQSDLEIEGGRYEDSFTLVRTPVFDSMIGLGSRAFSLGFRLSWRPAAGSPTRWTLTDTCMVSRFSTTSTGIWYDLSSESARAVRRSTTRPPVGNGIRTSWPISWSEPTSS